MSVPSSRARGPGPGTINPDFNISQHINEVVRGRKLTPRPSAPDDVVRADPPPYATSAGI